MPARQSKIVRLFAPVLLGAAVAIAAAGTVVIVSGNQAPPMVGDIIAFEPATNAGPDIDTRIVVHRPDQFGCILDLNTLRQTGGSLVVEARITTQGHSFRLHWAGQRTTTDSGDCGRSADLIVDHGDMDSLALAAGGYGIGRKRPVIPTMTAN